MAFENRYDPVNNPDQHTKNSAGENNPQQKLDGKGNVIQGGEVQRPAEHGQPVNPLEWSQKVNDKAPTDANEVSSRLQQDQLDRVSARGTAETRGNQSFTDTNGARLNGVLETRPGGAQYFSQPQADGTWQRSQVLKDNQGNQYLQQVDGNDRPIQGTQVTQLKTKDTGNTSSGGNHQQEFAPPPDHGNYGRGPRASGTDSTASSSTTTSYGSDSTSPGQTAKQQAEQYGSMTQEQRQDYRSNFVNPPPGGETFNKPAPIAEQGTQGNIYGKGDQSGNPVNQGTQGDLGGNHGDRGSNPGNHGDRSGDHHRSGRENPGDRGGENKPHQFSNEFKNMDQKQKQDALDNAERSIPGRPGDRGHPLHGKVEMDGKPDGKGGIHLEGLDKAALGKPGDPKFADMLARGAKPGDLLANLQIDGKLLAQLHTFKLDKFLDNRGQLADLIGKFQDGKYIPQGARESALFDMFRGLKPDQLTNLRNWATDGTRYPFDLRSLDIRSQHNISRIFETMMGQGHEGKTGRLLDFLTDRSHRFDRIPTGDQSRVLFLELVRGMRDIQHGIGKESGKDFASILGRSLGFERNSGDFRPGLRDSDPITQALLNRMQSRDFISSLMTERSAALSRLDGQQSYQLLGQVRDEKLGGLRLSELGKGMQIGREGEIVRGLTPQDQQLVRPGDPTQRAVGDASPLGESPTVKAGESSDKSKFIEDEAKKKKEFDDAQAIVAQKGLIDKEEQNKELEEEKEKKRKKEEEDRARELEEAKKKEEEEKRRQQEDSEFVYTVSSERETLVQIAAKFSGRTAEHIYARNLNDIMLKEFKGKKYAILYVNQKLIIPNNRWIDNYRMSMQSYGYVGFDGVPFDSAEDELIAKFGEKWAGAAGAGAIGSNKRIFSDEDDEPVNRRSFSGNDQLTDEERKQNVRKVLGLPSGGSEAESRYTVKLGQQLRNISQKLYGDPQLWRLLALKNNLSTDTDAKGEPVAQLRKGQQLVLPTEDEVEEFKNGTKKSSQESVVTGDDITEQVAPIELQEVTITDDQPSMDFSPEHENVAQPADNQDHTAVITTQTHAVKHPLPKAEYTDVQVDFHEDNGDDLDWLPNPEPEVLDQFVQIVETQIYVSDIRGLRISLQLLTGGEWITIYDYEIYPDEALVHQYRRSGGRTTTRRSLPAKQTKQMAGNHFHNAWQSICREFWRS